VAPVHALGAVLFSGHMLQHELLIAAAAPLLVLGRPLVPVLWALPAEWRRTAGAWTRVGAVRTTWRALTTPACAWLLHAIALWIWHLPAPYEAALASNALHTLQHASFLGTALLFWWALVHGRAMRMGHGTAVVYVFTTALHTGGLGALLTFAPAAWSGTYEGTTAAWGLTPLEDQQLAGLIMWVPGSFPYLLAALALTVAWLRESERRVSRWQQRIAVTGGE
jgi:putative membrane protein